MKKWHIPALIAVIITQLCVPVFMIVNKYDVLKTGEEFKFRVNAVDPYDPFRGRYVAISARPASYRMGKYGAIEVGEDGFAYISSISDSKPASGAYVKSGSTRYFLLPIDRYYMDETFAPRAEALAWRGNAYVTVRVKNGTLIVSGLYVDGIAIEEIIRNERTP